MTCSLNPILPIPVISIKSQLLPLGELLWSEPLTSHPSTCPQLATVAPLEAPLDSTEIPKSSGLSAVRRARTLNAPHSFLGNPWLGKVPLDNSHSSLLNCGSPHPVPTKTISISSSFKPTMPLLALTQLHPFPILPTVTP